VHRTLATRNIAVMARNTIAGEIGVIGHRRRGHPGVDAMALIALECGHHMRRSFTASQDAIVTARTGADGLRVIDCASR